MDPVCAAAANAYFDSFVAGAGRDQNGIIGIEKSNEYHMSLHSLNQGLVKGAKLCLDPYFFGWLEK